MVQDREAYQASTISATTRTTANGIDGAKHSIEHYQREYKWGTKRISELLEGLEARFFSSYGEEHERKQADGLLRYVVGDEITVRMELWHRMNLLNVNVVFEHHEDPAITLTLIGVPKFVRYVPSQDRREAGSSTGEVYRESEVLLRGEVDLEHLPGEYAVSHAEFYTASGQEIRHDIRSDKPIPSRIRVKNHTFGIMPEPKSIDRATLEFVDARTEEDAPSEG